MKAIGRVLERLLQIRQTADSPSIDALDNQAGHGRPIWDGAPTREQVGAGELPDTQRQHVVHGQSNDQCSEQCGHFDGVRGEQQTPMDAAQPDADEVHRDGGWDQRPVGRGQSGRDFTKLVSHAVGEKYQEGGANAEGNAETQRARAHDEACCSASAGRRSRGDSCSRAKKIRPRPVTNAYWTACETNTSTSAACGLATSPRS